MNRFECPEEESGTNFLVPEDSRPVRIDLWLSQQEVGFTRSYGARLIEQGEVQVNGQKVKRSYLVAPGDQITVRLPRPVPLEAKPQDIALDILYEDEHLAVVNKPRGMVVHPSAGHPDHTLVNALLFHMQGKLSGINGTFRPGIVHRIDKDTTGLLLVAKTDQAHQSLALQLKEHSITREYRLICHGQLPKEEWIIDAPLGRHPANRLKRAIVLGGREAKTHIWRLSCSDRFSYAAARLRTGRTHQIRVHLSSHGHPIVGDGLYGSASASLQGQLLHAALVGFIHPVSGQYMEFRQPLPEDFRQRLRKWNLALGAEEDFYEGGRSR